jgi:hypothetical protein
MVTGGPSAQAREIEPPHAWPPVPPPPEAVPAADPHHEPSDLHRQIAAALILLALLLCR